MWLDPWLFKRYFSTDHAGNKLPALPHNSAVVCFWLPTAKTALRFLTPAAILTCLHVSGMSVKLWLNSLAGRPPRSTTSTPPWSPSSPHEQVSSFQWPWSGGMNLSCACMWRRGWLQICEMDTNEFHFYHLPAPVFRAQQEQHLEN